jgi:hypothetical protein
VGRFFRKKEGTGSRWSDAPNLLALTSSLSLDEKKKNKKIITGRETGREREQEKREGTGPSKYMLFFLSFFPSSQGPTRLLEGEVKDSQTPLVRGTADWQPRGELYRDLQHTNKLEGDKKPFNNQQPQAPS